MKGFFKFDKNDPLGESERLAYEEKNGKLSYEYYKQVSVPTKVHAAVYEVYKSHGTIPKKIVDNGTDAIEKYVESKIKRDIAKQVKQRAKEDTFDKNPNFPIKKKYDGQVLTGKIISIEDTTLTVRLEKPYQGEKFVIYGFASAMSGHYILDEKGNFTSNAIEKAKELLVDIYKEKKHYKKHKKVIDITKKLNKSK